MTWRLPVNWIVQGVSFAAGALALWMAFSRWIYEADGELRYAVIFLSVVVFALLALSVYLGFRYARKARYAEALENACAGARTLSEQLSEGRKDLNDSLAELVEEVAESFTLITGTRVSACIKVCRGPEENPTVETLCRDRKSHRRYGDPRAGESRGGKVVHHVRSNTDFEYLLRHVNTPEGNYYLCNDLPTEPYYQNTSLSVIDREPDRTKMPVVSYFFRQYRWPLPYKSTLVVPIKGVSNGKMVIEGFLCVDSASRGVFDRRHDAVALQAAAEVAYPLLRDWSLTEGQYQTSNALEAQHV